MSTTEINSFRKDLINISLNESIDQLNEQLRHLLDNDRIHFSKRRKILLQLERKNNQHRRSIDRSDLHNQKIITINNNLIRCIKKKIIDEDRQQQQQRTNEQDEDTSWSLGGMATLFGAAFAGIISAATFIIMLLDRSKERTI
ncbi:unnamed protein product [Rotaria sp. Silwood2]|nr:unnamed protein product [Rotaria sp. Silwood2]CAF3358195.1 unnamed protein product [Rotaria sp. Silwood2]CAF4246296.1 unnamed protein product [Rotaria sp. Silwood2]CAF4381233.1 unnamed protein product [Rotaria sp. Silwood2]